MFLFLENEILSEKLTDVYLSHHQNNNSMKESTEKLNVQKKVLVTSEKSNKTFSLFNHIR